ncbi:UNKNOWN [Stylonychia lemnae]|uniref:Uncharacterized protein n=1 Tax=Stylonychia lemnae TaxID=5949 RepID=A0A078BD98_STYLE|nr:UNKNOWN [Stylonychia lemnae]|eukprot:CDW91563.1 UNKNOWN [Stylonychia lemnae]
MMSDKSQYQSQNKINKIGQKSFRQTQPNTTEYSNRSQYFDKPYKAKQIKQLVPEKTVDPYDMNTISGTRMPEYSQVIKQRDTYGELGWIPNFQVTFSKNNPRLHKNYQEYFDRPQEYHTIYQDANVTQSEFFRSQAPSNSVARTRRAQSSYRSTRQSMNFGNNQNFDDSQRFDQVSQSLIAPKATPFYLIHDKSNKHRIDKRVKETQSLKNCIPFLRVNDDDYKKVINQPQQKSFRRKQTTYISQYYENKPQNAQQRTRFQSGEKRYDQNYYRKAKRREKGWEQYILPISKLNTELHLSQKISFDKI